MTPEVQRLFVDELAALRNRRETLRAVLGWASFYGPEATHDATVRLDEVRKQIAMVRRLRVSILYAEWRAMGDRMAAGA